MNLMEKLAREISRVTMIKAHFEEIGQRRQGNVIVQPQIEMMDRSLEAAFKAAGTGEAVDILNALIDMQEYSE